MNFPAAVNAQHQIRHLPISEIQNLIIQQNTICRQRKTEFFVIRFFQAPAVLHQFLYHLPVHQWFSAEEIHFQIHTAAGISHQEIQRLSAHIKAHQSTPSMVLALFRKTILTGQITVMGNVKTESLHHRLPFLKIKHIILIDIRCK